MKLHALPPLPPPPPPVQRLSTQPAEIAVALPFQKEAVPAVRPSSVRQGSVPARGAAAAAARGQAPSRNVAPAPVAQGGAANAAVAYRRGSLLDIEA